MDRRESLVALAGLITTPFLGVTSDPLVYKGRRIIIYNTKQEYLDVCYRLCPDLLTCWYQSDSYDTFIKHAYNMIDAVEADTPSNKTPVQAFRNKDGLTSMTIFGQDSYLSPFNKKPPKYYQVILPDLKAHKVKNYIS